MLTTRLRLLISLSLICLFQVKCQLTLNTLYTPWNSHGGGDIHYLDRHYIACPGRSVISFWKVHESGGNITFEYRCLSGPAVLGESEWRYTSWNGVASNVRTSIDYLDRHTVICNNDEAINTFTVQRSGNHIRYAYICMKVKYSGHNQSRTTSWTDADRGEMFELRDQYVEPTNYHNQAIYGFRLNVQYYTGDWWVRKMRIYYDVWFMTLRDLNDNNLNNMN
jgi:hypothetical protein